MTIDLDAHASPPADAETLKRRREVLLDQMGWIEDEANALAPLLGALPPWAVEGAPLPTDLSVLDTLAALVRLDRDLYPAWFDAAETGTSAALSIPSLLPAPPPSDDDLPTRLAAVAAARADLRVRAAAVPPEAWSRPLTVDGQETDLYGATLRIVQHDADRLREIAYRIHEADVTMRPQTG